MSKTFKRSRVSEDSLESSHHFRFKRSRTDYDVSKHIDKYIKTQDFDKLEDYSEYESGPVYPIK